MKKIFFWSLLFCATALIAFSCSKENDNNSIHLNKETIVGTWDVIWFEQNGTEMEIPSGYIYMTLRSDGSYRTFMINDSYIGTYRIDGNTVIGTTLDPITEYYRFTRLEGSYAEIDYSNRVGNKMKFKVNKR